MRGITSASTLISILELALLSAERSTHLKENSPALAKLREGVAAAVEELRGIRSNRGRIRWDEQASCEI